ncbi:MAG: DNA polymerase III subunit delta [Planctomycetota bacterium]|jgi:DNA polymerase III delta subunit
MTSTLPQLDALNAAMRIVVLHGQEVFLLTEGAKRLCGLLEAEHGKDAIQRFTFDGETAEPADVLDELRTFGLFRDHKLVIVDKADVFLRGGAKAKGEGDEDADSKSQGAVRRRALEAYAENPCAGATLLLRAEKWHRGKLDKLVAGVGAVVKCEPLKDAAAVRWAVAASPVRHGLTIKREAARLLVERLGPGLARLDTELAKLAAFVGPGREIDRKDVAELVGLGREEQGWELQTAIMTGRPGEACAKMRELVEISRLDTVLVMWAVSDLLRRLHTVAQLSRQGGALGSYIRPLRLWDDTGRRIIEVAGRTDPGVFARLLERAVRTDLASKTGLGEADRNLEALTLHVTDTIGSL